MHTQLAEGKKMYSFGAPTASACPVNALRKRELEHTSQSSFTLCACVILSFCSAVSVVVFIVANKISKYVTVLLVLQMPAVSSLLLFFNKTETDNNNNFL